MKNKKMLKEMLNDARCLQEDYDLEKARRLVLKIISQYPDEPDAYLILEQLEGQLQDEIEIQKMVKGGVEKMRNETGRLNDEDSIIRQLEEADDIELIWGLMKAIRSKPSLQTLKKIVELSGEPDNDVIECALFSLGKLSSQNKITESLIQLCQEQGTPISIRLRCIQLLGWSGAVSSVPMLISLLNANDNMLRAEAATAIVNIGSRHEQVISAMIRNLSATDSEVRIWSAIGLGRVGQGNDKVLHALLGRLNAEPSDSVKDIICESLAGLGDKRAITPLGNLILKNDTDDDVVITAAVVALENLGGDKSIKLLHKALKRGIGEDKKLVRGFILRALNNISKREK